MKNIQCHSSLVLNCIKQTEECRSTPLDLLVGLFPFVELFTEVDFLTYNQSLCNGSCYYQKNSKCYHNLFTFLCFS